MRQKKPSRMLFKRKQIKSMLVFYIILLAVIIILVWKMRDIVAFI